MACYWLGGQLALLREHRSNIKVLWDRKRTSYVAMTGTLPPFLPKQEKLSGENMSVFEREKGTAGNKEDQHFWRGWPWCCKGVIAGRVTVTVCTARDAVALQGPPATLEMQVYLGIKQTSEGGEVIQ